MSFQLSSKQSIADVWIAQLDRKRVPQVRSSGCKSSVAVTAVCSWHHGKSECQLTVESAERCRTRGSVICQVERRLPRQRLANKTCHFELDTLSDGQPVEFTQYRCHVIAASRASDQPRGGVLHRLQVIYRECYDTRLSHVFTPVTFTLTR